MTDTIKLLLLAIVLTIGPGCSDIVKFAVDKTQPRGFSGLGIAYYVGGAGPAGNIGSFDVPRGLRDAGFLGNVEVVPWQSWTHAGDQLNLSRNRHKASELAEDIRAYRRRQPDAPIHLIALSAGTGIATFALEYLPESVQVDNVIFLGCSMSAQYDLSRALRRVRGKMYVLYSSNDIILKNLVWYTGTVDRHEGSEGIAGLEGFRRPRLWYPDTAGLYDKVVNVPFRSEFRDAGYDGGHTAATNKSFVQYYIAPAMMENDRRLVGSRRDQAYHPPEYVRNEERRAEPKATTETVSSPSGTSIPVETDPLRPAELEPPVDDGEIAIDSVPPAHEGVDAPISDDVSGDESTEPARYDADDPPIPADDPQPESA